MSAIPKPHSPVYDHAQRVLPGGTFGNTGADLIIREGQGSRVWDEDGNEYVDYLIGSGPMIVGHNHPEVTAAVQAQLQLGAGLRHRAHRPQAGEQCHGDDRERHQHFDQREAGRAVAAHSTGFRLPSGSSASRTSAPVGSSTM